MPVVYPARFWRDLNYTYWRLFPTYQPKHGKKSPKCLLRYFKKCLRNQTHHFSKASFKHAPSLSLGPCQHGTVQYHNHQLFDISHVSHVTTQLIHPGPVLTGGPWRKTKPTLAGRNLKNRGELLTSKGLKTENKTSKSRFCSSSFAESCGVGCVVFSYSMTVLEYVASTQCHLALFFFWLRKGYDF